MMCHHSSSTRSEDPTIRIALRFSVTTRKKPRPARKSPQQARSQVTVEAILDGAIRVLDQDPPAPMTTSHIATAAGVSIGTLYQYFSNKESILDALQDREFERAGAMLAARLTGEDLRTPRAVAHAVISGLLELYRSATGLHRLLVLEGLHVAPTERVQAFDAKLVGLLRNFFERTDFQIKRPNKYAAAFVLYQSVRATLLAAILEGPGSLSDDELVSEVTDMVVAHLVNEEDT